ncbi:unnamed protein product [Linum trigynum]|uniref:Uncharacterized protein n=1 Tax=Linum trigynum TaxID=586398 RepID=A0AAV2FV57_9ROSI
MPGIMRRPNLPQKRPFCTFCKKEGHTEDTCYQKHGWPPDFGTRTPSSIPPWVVECAFCKKHGHTVDICFRKNGFPLDFASRTSTSSYGRGRGRGYANTASSPQQEDEIKLTRSEYEKLMNLMSSQKGQSSHAAAAFVTNRGSDADESDWFC